MTATTKAGAWGQLNGDGYVGWLPDARAGTAARRTDAQGHGAADVCVSRPLDQAAAARDAAARRARRRSRAKTARSPSRRRQAICRCSISRARRDGAAISSRSPNASSARPICGAARASLGIDCSGLVQIALTACGTGCPRDSDMQQDGLGRALDAAEIDEPAARRPDLLERPRRDRARCRHASCTPTRITWRPRSSTRRGDRAHQGRPAARSPRSSG